MYKKCIRRFFCATCLAGAALATMARPAYVPGDVGDEHVSARADNMQYLSSDNEM